MPKVSVIIPVYGVEKYIERCARSLFEQTLDDIEFIFVDDCTPDKSIEVLNSVLEVYPNRRDQVRIIRHEVNKGLPIARQTGILNATGDFIAHCDSDDWVEPNIYERLYTQAISENTDVVVCGYNKHDGNVCLSQKCGITNKSNDLDTNIWDCILDKTPWAVWNKLIKRSLYEGIVYPQNNMGEDMCLTLQLYSKHPKISYVDQYLYYYFVNPESIMNKVTKETTIRNFKQLKDNVDCLVIGLKQNGTYPQNKKYTDYLYYRTSNILLPFIKEKEVFDIWRNHFRNRNMSILCNRHISTARKIRHILIFFRILK